MEEFPLLSVNMNSNNNNNNVEKIQYTNGCLRSQQTQLIPDLSPVTTPTTSPTTPTKDTIKQQIRSYNKWSVQNDGATLIWRDLCVYAINDSRKNPLKRIINNVSGAIKPGELIALMGASGAGKSTLMSALAHRSAAGTLVQGDILVNGRHIGPFMHRLSGFVHQEDLFFGSLTVLEHITFMANFKLDRRTRQSEKNKLIFNLLERSGLAGCAHTKIGFDGDGKVLSGGEKKRLAFATELLTNPKILFCDEPTTGLDSYSAQQLVETLQMLANSGTAIICTIHQPSSSLFAMFHQVLLLAEGRVAFMGPPLKALDFFAGHGYLCPKSYNPADFLIGILASAPGCENASKRTITRFCDLFAVSDESQQRDLLINLEIHMAESNEFTNFNGDLKFKSPYWHKTVFWLIHRSLLTVLRDPTVQILRTIQKIVIGVVAGLCFSGTIDLTQTGVQSVQGAIFIGISENTFNPMYSVLSYFPQLFPLFLREKKTGIYSTAQYYIANLIAMLPGLIVEPALFIIIGYWLAGLRSTIYAFFITMLITTLVLNVSTACGCFFSTAFNSLPLAMAVLIPFDYILMITSGVFVKLDSLPGYVSWTKYMSWLMYANEGLSIVQWEGVTNITCPISNENLPCLRNGDEVMEKYSFSFDNLSRDIWGLIVLYICFHIFGYLFLLRKSRKS